MCGGEKLVPSAEAWGAMAQAVAEIECLRMLGFFFSRYYC